MGPRPRGCSWMPGASPGMTAGTGAVVFLDARSRSGRDGWGWGGVHGPTGTVVFLDARSRSGHDGWGWGGVSWTPGAASAAGPCGAATGFARRGGTSVAGAAFLSAAGLQVTSGASLRLRRGACVVWRAAEIFEGEVRLDRRGRRRIGMALRAPQEEPAAGMDARSKSGHDGWEGGTRVVWVLRSSWANQHGRVPGCPEQVRA